IVTAPGSGGSPNVRTFDTSFNIKTSTFAYDPAFRGGAFVATGDMDSTTGSEIVTGAGPGGTAHVRILDGVTEQLVGEFIAYAPVFGPASGFATPTKPQPPSGNNPPDVSTPIADVSVSQNATPTVLDLSQNFSDPDVGQSVVHMDTSAGPIDVDLFDQ